MTKGTAFSIISGKEDNLARYTEISGNSQGACILPWEICEESKLLSCPQITRKADRMWPSLQATRNRFKGSFDTDVKRPA